MIFVSVSKTSMGEVKVGQDRYSALIGVQGDQSSRLAEQVRRLEKENLDLLGISPQSRQQAAMARSSGDAPPEGNPRPTYYQSVDGDGEEEENKKGKENWTHITFNL